MAGAPQNVIFPENDVEQMELTVGDTSQIHEDDVTKEVQRGAPTSTNKETHDAKGTVGDGKSGDNSGLKMLKTLTGRQIYTLFVITSGSCLAGVTSSLVGPIYSIGATRKGMSMTLVGLVYGLFGVVMFCTAPFFGTYLTKLGPKFTFIAGTFVGGCCNILFGTVFYCRDGAPFIVMSILVRCTEAIGFSAYITSSFAIVSSEFKKNIGFVFGILETGNGLGYMLGPTIGGALYEVGGFGLPFYVAGGLVLINGLLVFNLLPQVEDVSAKRKASMLGLFRSPLLTVSVGCLFISGVSVGTFHSTFAKHEETLDISVFMIGVLFGMSTIIYSITCIFWGYISDNTDHQAPLMIGGQFVYGLGFLILGPSFLFPFIPFTISTTIIAAVLLGASFGCILIPTMKCMVEGAVEIGFEDNIDTYALVSGLFHGVYILGKSTGPVAMGALIEEYGYPITYTVTGMLNILCVAMYVILFTLRHLKKNEYEDIDANEEERILAYQKNVLFRKMSIISQ